MTLRFVCARAVAPAMAAAAPAAITPRLVYPDIVFLPANFSFASLTPHSGASSSDLTHNPLVPAKAGPRERTHRSMSPLDSRLRGNERGEVAALITAKTPPPSRGGRA